MHVLIKDRKDHIEYVRTILNMVEIAVDYPTAELIYNSMKKLKEKAGSFTISDGCELVAEHHDKWDKYIKEKEKGVQDV